jgi:hypothetical protein
MGGIFVLSGLELRTALNISKSKLKISKQEVDEKTRPLQGNHSQVHLISEMGRSVGQQNKNILI